MKVMIFIMVFFGYYDNFIIYLLSFCFGRVARNGMERGLFCHQLHKTFNEYNLKEKVEEEMQNILPENICFAKKLNRIMTHFHANSPA